jgi:hypothetical protein
MKRTPFKLFLALLMIFSLVGFEKETKINGSDECLECHKDESPGMVAHWEGSVHAKKNVTCLDCHEAKKGDKDLMDHYDHDISVIVSPKDCAKCHEKEATEFKHSHHADGGKILGSLDNVLAEIVEGALWFDGQSAAAVSGCKQCHGSVVEIDENGHPTPTTWPNSGIGRINPDGSKGSCTACHSRHSFDVVTARNPENCGKCHMGPDHPQIEIYNESKHGIKFRAHKDKMNMDAQPDWRVGIEYTAAPTCATCHMSATKELPVTHDVGARISWTLRPPISEKVDAKAIKAGKKVKSWQDRRADMQNVCSKCHSEPFVTNFYRQYDEVIKLYNNKFAKPATKLYKAVRSAGLITNNVNFDDELEWTYFYLWHHEGRRVRMAAAMGGPDYTQWHGFYDVAENFYMKFIPQVKEVLHHNKNSEKTKKIETMLSEILNREEHKWFLGKMNPNEVKKRKKAAKEFRSRYAGD